MVNIRPEPRLRDCGTMHALFDKLSEEAENPRF